MEKRIPITVERIEALKHGRIKVKIKERHINLATLNHKGHDYVTCSSMGRGRYIMKEVLKEAIKKESNI